jgi:hypothetical protein
MSLSFCGILNIPIFLARHPSSKHNDGKNVWYWYKGPSVTLGFEAALVPMLKNTKRDASKIVRRTAKETTSVYRNANAYNE